jgi:signal transduction histidine kinase
MVKTAKKKPDKLEDLQEVLQMYNEVTQRLQISHERLQAEVARLTAQLEEKNRELEMKKRLAALGEMAAGIAHEIRNPLGGIQLYASSLLQEVSDRPLAGELVRKISSGVKGLNSLVCDMLAFTGNMMLHRADEDLGEIVERAVEFVRPTLLAHGVELQAGESLAKMRVNVDGKLLERVLLNLLLNASQAIAECEGARAGSSSPCGRIAIRARHAASKTEIIVEDNGPGIPQEVLERIFNPFFTTRHTGTGLGLAIVHRIVEAHGGVITAENRTPERGARFRIVL